jgi:hypothetical protein
VSGIALCLCVDDPDVADSDVCPVCGHMSHLEVRCDSAIIIPEPLDVDRMTWAIERELHVDPEHGFPAGFTPRDLAHALADHYDHAPDALG